MSKQKTWIATRLQSANTSTVGLFNALKKIPGVTIKTQMRDKDLLFFKVPPRLINRVLGAVAKHRSVSAALSL